MFWEFFRLHRHMTVACSLNLASFSCHSKQMDCVLIPTRALPQLTLLLHRICLNGGEKNHNPVSKRLAVYIFELNFISIKLLNMVHARNYKLFKFSP